MAVLFSTSCHGLVGLNGISIINVSTIIARSHVLRYKVEKAIESEFSLTLGKFYVFCVHVLYTQCSKLPFSVKHAK